MTNKRILGTLALGVTLVAGWTDGSALTLGRLRGAALLGQPLEVTVPLQFSSDEDPTQSCFEADVFYGDIRKESSALVSASGEQGTAVRIRSVANVDEPVVTVYLKAVCGQKTARRYVLLADLASEITPSPVVSTPVPAQVPLVAELPKVKSNGKSVDVSGRSLAASNTSHLRREPQPRPVAGNASVAVEAKAVKPPRQVVESGRKARLKLTPFDMSLERDPLLRSSDELLSTPTEDLQKRVEALAMWRALNASAQDVLRDEARMQALEGDLKRLADVTAKNRLALQDVNARLEVSESQRYANPLVYGLVVGLIVCLAALVFLWQRLRRASGVDQPWWRSAMDVEDESMLREDLADVQGPLVDASPSVNSGFAATAVAAVSTPDATQTAGVDIDLEMGESVFAPAKVLEQQTLTPPLVQGPASERGVLRAINTREMLDVRQQAEFFITLGQYNDAIHLLESSIRGASESNPLVYLDLLKALHTLSRKAAFDTYRSEFNQMFTGIAPPYAKFNLGGRGLDAYPEICQQIVALWPTEAAIAFMESCMVRAPEDAPDQGFDLEAFRELLLLHAVGRLLLAGANSGMAPFSAARPPQSGEATMPMPSIPQAASGQSLVPVDLDLSEPHPTDNLIDFDISGYTGNGKGGTPGGVTG